MKAWQIFAVGTGAVIAAVLLPAYESLIAGVGALVILGVVVFGFLVRPRRTVFYLRTAVPVFDPDYPLTIEHDRIAIRVEVARLWLLFVPTFLAMAFLVITFARGTTWTFSLWGSDMMARAIEAGPGPYPVLLATRLLVMVVIGLISTWVSERWVLRDAEADRADYLSTVGGRVLYSFKDRLGEYYGGEAFPFGLVRPRQLATVVFYRAPKPDFSKIGMGLLFHRLIVVGRGLTDLDESTASAHAILAPVSVRR